jgi:hypothetical protein
VTRGDCSAEGATAVAPVPQPRWRPSLWAARRECARPPNFLTSNFLTSNFLTSNDLTSNDLTPKELTVKKKAAVSGAVLAGAAVVAVVLANSALGTDPHPYQYADSTGNAKGALAFYDASGTAITSGSINAPIAAYVKGAGDLRPGDTTASLYVYAPTGSQSATAVSPTGSVGGTAVTAADWSGFANQPNEPGAWAGQLLSVSSASGTYPGALAGAGAPVVTVDADSWSVADIATDFAHSGDATDVQGIYELRLKTGAVGQSTTTQYDHQFIKVTGSTWQVFDTATDNSGGGTGTTTPTPNPSPTNGTKTTPTVAVAPTASAPTYGTGFTVAVTVSGASTPAGTVTLASGATTLGSASLADGKATFPFGATTLAAGVHTLTANYSGSATFNAASGTANVTVAKQTPKVGATLAKTQVKRSAHTKLTVKVTTTGFTFTGTVKLYDGSKVLKTLSLAAKNKGSLAVTLPTLKVGTHKLKAVSVAATNVATASSKVASLKVTK